MKHWRLLLIGFCVLLVITCAVTTYGAVFSSPAAFVPHDATSVQVHQMSWLYYEATYRAAHPLRDWRLATIQRLTSQGWARGRLPDSNRYDRSLWFVRRRNLGFMSVFEQVSIQAGGGETPPVLVIYRRRVASWWFGQ
jgi:hypothetical protein